MSDNDKYLPISSYALIGDCHTAALVSPEGSIDWYCPGRFDAPAVFCRLLDADKGGYMKLSPVEQHSSTRSYLGSTNLLKTTFSGTGWKLHLTDLMPIHQRQSGRRGYDVGSSRRILRWIEAEGDEVELDLEFKPTFNFARATTSIHLADGGAVTHGHKRYMTIACPAAQLKVDGEVVRARLKVKPGQPTWVVLTDAEDPDRAREALSPVHCDEQVERTKDYWKKWADRCTYQGPYRKEVLRSALTLKMLTYEPTGAIVAAPTASLPEEFGGVRNWDYRFSWLRDASLILYSLMTVGYQEEATDFLRWLHNAGVSDPTPTPQIMYMIDGGRDIKETILPNLEGYRKSKPVRIGNGAAGQFQLDIYGEVLTAAYLHFRINVKPGTDEASDSTRDGMKDQLEAKRHGPAPQTWSLLKGFVEQAAKRWQEPDNGIWEVRGGAQQFLYSRLMCWAALDRGVKLAEEYHLHAPLDEWRKTRDDVRNAILTQGYNEDVGAFTQSFGSRALDSSALIIPLIGFLPPTDRRVQSTVDRIQKGLTRDGLAYRYRTDDGLPGGEATFTLCSFWLVDALALGGRLNEAHDLFEKVVGYANDVGLLSEELDPISGEFLGNFPQGFTHLALIRSAVNLAKAGKHGAEEEAETEADRASRAQHASSEKHFSPTRRS